MERIFLLVKRIWERCKDLWRIKTGGNLYKYGSYQEYKEAQIAGNKRKQEVTWVQEENIRIIAQYVRQNAIPVEFVLCHGTRNGKEQALFKKYLQARVLGTEISPTATRYPDTIEWDFHEVQPAWVNAVDLVYSNALDHSYDPEKCLDAWMSCVRKSGCCVLEWSPKHAIKTKTDPFAGSLEDYKGLIEKKYKIRDILEGGLAGPEKNQPTKLFFVSHILTD